MAGGILNIGTSALTTLQSALATTSHNIANVNTEGYSRQRVDLATRPPQRSGSGFIGTGVQAVDVNRVIDEFLNNQLQSNISAHAQFDAFASFAAQVDNLLADPDAGLSPALQSFFNAVDDVANDPGSMPARQVLLAEAESLASRFHFIDQRLTEIDFGARTKIENTVTELNLLAQSIADLNRDIVLAKGVGAGSEPNDLLDQRDLLLNQLAEIIDVNTVEQEDGALNVFVGIGQVLVLNTTASSIAVVPGSDDPSDIELALQLGANQSVISSAVSGGVLGGLLDFRADVIDAARNELGRIAIAVAETVNQQHQLGQDLNGNFGGELFVPINTTTTAGRGPQFFSSLNNAGTTNVNGTVTVTDVTELVASDYRLLYNAGNFDLIRLKDNVNLGTFSAAGLPPGPITLDFAQAGIDQGFEVTLTGTSISNGDSFLIKPVANGADDFSLALVDPAAIAAASPITAFEQVDPVTGVPTNLGTGVISGEAVTNRLTGTTAPWPDYTLTFTAPDVLAVTATTSGGVVTLTPAGAGNYNPATDSGGVLFTLTDSTFGTLTFDISGVPQNGDQFEITTNSQAVGDNSNALSLSQLRTTRILSGGTASYQQSYSQLVASVGVRSHQANVSRDAQFNLLEQVKSSQQEVSGVNLDEEAANLVQFQQAYQAAAQLIATGQLLFDTLIGAFRR